MAEGDDRDVVCWKCGAVLIPAGRKEAIVDFAIKLSKDGSRVEGVYCSACAPKSKPITAKG